jgi:hypothetical protein
VRPRLVKAGRSVKLLNAPVVALLIWAALLIVIVLISKLTGTQPMLCWFRRISTIPCPSCGSTRGVLSLLEGDVLGAFLKNPLVMTTLTILAVGFGLRFFCGLKLEWNLTSKERWAAWALAGAALLANWAWVISWHQQQ